jgi:hypothetical protein
MLSETAEQLGRKGTGSHGAGILLHVLCLSHSDDRRRNVGIRENESQRRLGKGTKNDFQFWSDHGWTVEPGTSKVWIGPSSVEGLKGTFERK